MLLIVEYGQKLNINPKLYAAAPAQGRGHNNNNAKVAALTAYVQVVTKEGALIFGTICVKKPFVGLEAVHFSYEALAWGDQ